MLLHVLLSVYGILSIASLVFMAILHFFHDSKGYYKTAMGVWAGVLLAFVADGAISENGGKFYHVLGIPLIVITMFSFAHLTAQTYELKLDLKKYAKIFAATWVTGALLHFVFSAPFTPVSLIICAGIVAPALDASYQMFRRWGRLNIIDRFLTLVILAEAVHILDYPFVRNLEGAAVFGFSIGLILIYCASILIPVVINQRIGRDKLLNTAKMAALGEMAGGIAHEINNPLATIKSSSTLLTELLAEQPLDTGLIGDLVATVERTTDRIAKIVHGLRLFSRDGSRDLCSETVVYSLIEDTLSLCQARLKNHEVRLTLDPIPEDLKFDVREVEISQVLLNLLNNSYDAIQALPDKWIKISARDAGEFVEIRISDCGRGIPANVAAKMFQPFYTTKDVNKGTGMGLSISLGIVLSHGGELRLDDQSPNTCFVLILPKKQMAALAAPATTAA